MSGHEDLADRAYLKLEGRALSPSWALLGLALASSPLDVASMPAAMGAERMGCELQAEKR